MTTRRTTAGPSGIPTRKAVTDSPGMADAPTDPTAVKAADADLTKSPRMSVTSLMRGLRFSIFCRITAPSCRTASMSSGSGFSLMHQRQCFTVRCRPFINRSACQYDTNPICLEIIRLVTQTPLLRLPSDHITDRAELLHAQKLHTAIGRIQKHLYCPAITLQQHQQHSRLYAATFSECA